MTLTPAYATVTEADEYFLSSPDAVTWLSDATVTATKTAMLIRASDTIDRLKLKGCKALSTQSRAFPRSLTYTIQTAVPALVKTACIEEANEMLKQLATTRLGLQRQGVASVGYSGASETFKPGAGHGLLSVVAKDCLSQFRL
jgi:hypothetical protein